jgi:hypothetical protein
MPNSKVDNHVDTQVRFFSYLPRLPSDATMSINRKASKPIRSLNFLAPGVSMATHGSGPVTGALCVFSPHFLASLSETDDQMPFSKVATRSPVVPLFTARRRSPRRFTPPVAWRPVNSDGCSPNKRKWQSEEGQARGGGSPCIGLTPRGASPIEPSSKKPGLDWSGDAFGGPSRRRLAGPSQIPFIQGKLRYVTPLRIDRESRADRQQGQSFQS